MRIDWPGLLVSYLAAIGTGWVLWPPGAVYWEGLATVIGSGPTLVLVGAIAILLGAIVRWLPTVHGWPFLAGAVGAYLTGMVWIGHAFVPDSPVHLVWYLGLLACFLLGGFFSAKKGPLRIRIAKLGQ